MNDEKISVAAGAGVGSAMETEADAGIVGVPGVSVGGDKTFSVCTGAGGAVSTGGGGGRTGIRTRERTNGSLPDWCGFMPSACVGNSISVSSV